MSDPILSLPQLSSIERPFEGDKFGRKQLVEQLTAYLYRLSSGAVLAIDAPWGEGKTWFGKNWAEHLRNDSYKVIYVDAFEQDYIEDPFMLISAEIMEIIDEGVVEDFKQSSLNVTKALLPVAVKALFNVSGRVLLGTSSLTEDVSAALSESVDESGNLMGEWIKKNLESHTQNKRAMSQFKESLSSFAQSQDRPVVIFIDELDRCQPTFAVKLIERIKHFFDVPNLVFVLLLNREQLEKAVRGVYGNDTDAATYLGKFVNFFFQLPKPDGLDNHYAEQKYTSFVEHTFARYQFSVDENCKTFIRYLVFWAIEYKLSLRDIEKIIAYYAFAFPVHKLNYLMVYVIMLKLKHNDLFLRLKHNDHQAHEIAKKQIEDLIAKAAKKDNSSAQSVLVIFKEWHEAHLNHFQTIGENFKAIERDLFGTGIGLDRIFNHLAKKIELTMEIR